METPSNPGLKMVDIEKVSEIVRRRKDVLLAIDNTFLSPYFQVGFIEQRSNPPSKGFFHSIPKVMIYSFPNQQRPLELGADIVMNSATKYLNGHSDVLMGMLLTSNDEVHDRLRFLQRSTNRSFINAKHYSAIS